ncbi:MAG: signal peptidase II [Desulfitobacteriaceae bacterium]
MLVWLTMAGVWLIDRLMKVAVQSHFVPGESVVIVPKVFHVTYVLNPGAAFGLMAGRTWIFIVAAAIVVLGILYTQAKVPRQEVIFRLALGMIGGGALGNLYDRVRTGLVVDYLDFRIWPFVFNFADSMIVVGVGLLLLTVLLGDSKAKRKEQGLLPEQEGQ